MGDDRDELRDKRNDLLNIRGLLSPNGGVQVVPMELGDTVAPAVEWLVRDRAELVEERADLVGQRDRLRRERDLLGFALTKALETVATGSDLRQRFVDRALQAEAERDRRSDELRRAQGVIGRVRALHAQHDGRCTECVEHCDCLDRVKELGDDVEVAAALRMCPHGNKVWPCPTSDALETPSPP